MACTMEDLIERVREKPILWDLNHMYFRDVGRKRDTWDMVAEECGLYDGEEARQAWAKLRNSHREAKRRRMEDKKMKPWKYEEQMEFLLPDAKRSSTNVTSVTDNETDEKGHVEPVHVELEMDDADNSPDDETYPDDDDDDTYSILVVDSKKDKYIKSFGRKPNSKWERESDNHNASSAADFSERSERTSIKRPINEERVSDGLTELFSGLCDKTRNLPKYLQLRVQREIFDSITKAEEEALRLSSSSASVAVRKKVILKRKNRVAKRNSKSSYKSPFHKPSADINKVSDSNRSQLESSIDPIGNIVIKSDPVEVNLESDY